AAIGIVFWGLTGAVLTIIGSAGFFIIGAIFTITELKAMKANNKFKKLCKVSSGATYSRSP
ncbi:MAG: hypothetical protein FWH01_16880, partial [Oscillospiraceae bacterium]|nr:hypothetical protein [Oscillospiraceae bacterium]